MSLRPDGTVEIVSPRAEMGQGVATALRQIAAEETGVGFERVFLRASAHRPCAAGPRHRSDRTRSAIFAPLPARPRGLRRRMNAPGGGRPRSGARPARRWFRLAAAAKALAAERAFGVPRRARSGSSDDAVVYRMADRRLPLAEVAHAPSCSTPTPCDAARPAASIGRSRRIRRRPSPEPDGLAGADHRCGWPLFSDDVRLPDLGLRRRGLRPPRLGARLDAVDDGSGAGPPLVSRSSTARAFRRRRWGSGGRRGTRPGAPRRNPMVGGRTASQAEIDAGDRRRHGGIPTAASEHTLATIGPTPTSQRHGALRRRGAGSPCRWRRTRRLAAALRRRALPGRALEGVDGARRTSPRRARFWRRSSTSTGRGVVVPRAAPRRRFRRAHPILHRQLGGGAPRPRPSAGRSRSAGAAEERVRPRFPTGPPSTRPDRGGGLTSPRAGIAAWRHRFRSGHVIYTSGGDGGPLLQRATSFVAIPASRAAPFRPTPSTRSASAPTDVRLPVDTGPFGENGLGRRPERLRYRLRDGDRRVGPSRGQRPPTSRSGSPINSEAGRARAPPADAGSASPRRRTGARGRPAAPGSATRPPGRLPRRTRSARGGG